MAALQFTLTGQTGRIVQRASRVIFLAPSTPKEQCYAPGRQSTYCAESLWVDRLQRSSQPHFPIIRFVQFC